MRLRTSLLIGCLACLLTMAHCDDADDVEDVAVDGIRGLWSPLMDWVLLSRDKKVMKMSPAPPRMQPGKITRPPGAGQGSPAPGQGVTETDLYLLGAIEKLVYRVDFMEKRLRRAEEMIYYVMAGSNDKVGHEPCPANFTRVGRNCYHFSHRQYNWKSAASMCKSLGSNLAELESIEENQDVVSFLRAQQEFRGRDYWTGGLNPGLLWIWANSARPVSSNNATASATDNIQGNGRCLKLAFVLRLQSYMYEGSDCSLRTNYICEIEENTTSRALERISRQLKGVKVEGLLGRRFTQEGEE